MVIAVVLTLIGMAVIGKALYIMTAKKQYWTEVADRLKRDSVPVKPVRGNILSSEGQLMASSIPQYRIFMDFQAAAFEESDSLWLDKVDSVCEGLARIFPQMTATEFKQQLEEGRHKVNKNGTTGARHWPIWKKRINFDTYVEVKSLPFFKMPKYKSGFHEEEFNSRRRPFGTLAQRVIGGMYGAKDSAYFGLEQSFDSILRGTPGITGRRKVLNKYMNIPVLMPVDGADIVTTIDVNMQDIAERALLDMLKSPQVNGELGVAILMEVETGDVKAIVNMMRTDSGEYAEAINSAISYRCEPGSVFKVASFLVALDDELDIDGHKVDTSYVIHTGCGIRDMHGRPMKDHNWRRGGYGDINMAQTLEYSSNIGVSHVIDKIYHDQPERYVKGLYRVGIHEDLKLPLVGYLPPRIRMPEKNSRGQYTNWSKTALPWMSIGYETQIAPINTIAFYNAIANNGKMMRPRFVKKVVKNGETIAEYPPQVIKERIAKPKAIKTMQTILEHVVSQGLGKKAGSPHFKVAGKTGTAQVADQYGGYHSGITRYWLSFAGYFPADKPRYSCIVCIKKTGLPASGGGMSGVVFHHIAEGVMARNLKMKVEDARDENSIVIPDVKNGNLAAASHVLTTLGINTNEHWDGSYANSNPIWGTAERQADQVRLSRQKTAYNITPDVTGMGAKDAVYLLESRGLSVKLSGRGKVRHQSYAAGKEIMEGSECLLILE